MKSKISLIIPSLNEEKRIETLIDDNRICDDFYNELILANGHSMYETAVPADLQRK
jgi:glycosyltransferase involved in cell wall biosynthesis